VVPSTKAHVDALEREIKLRFESPEAARAAITFAGARPLRSRRLQSDVLFDTEERALSARGQVLRVRIEAGTATSRSRVRRNIRRSNSARNSKRPSMTASVS
jgi:adenylate cyclase class IV